MTRIALVLSIIAVLLAGGALAVAITHTSVHGVSMPEPTQPGCIISPDLRHEIAPENLPPECE